MAALCPSLEGDGEMEIAYLMARISSISTGLESTDL